MDKRIIFFLVLGCAAALTLCSCGNAEKETSTEKPSAKSREEKKAEPLYGGKPLSHWAAQMQSGKDKDAIEAIDKLAAAADKDAVDALIKALAYPEMKQLKSIVFSKLGASGRKTAVPALLKGVDDEDFYVRMISLRHLSKLGDKSLLPLFVKALGDEESSVRSSGVLGIAEFGDESNVPALLVTLGKEGNGQVREEIVDTLGKFGDASVAPALVKMLGKAEDLTVRNKACDALGAIGRGAIPALIEALRSDDPTMRGEALNLLRLISGESFENKYESWQVWWEANKDRVLKE